MCGVWKGKCPDSQNFKVHIFWEGHKILTTVHTDKSKVEILQNFAAFSEYTNFNLGSWLENKYLCIPWVSRSVELIVRWECNVKTYALVKLINQICSKKVSY